LSARSTSPHRIYKTSFERGLATGSNWVGPPTNTNPFEGFGGQNLVPGWNPRIDSNC
jgi:hypothetical protein